jgi:hypothetical protein
MPESLCQVSVHALNCEVESGLLIMRVQWVKVSFSELHMLATITIDPRKRGMATCPAMDEDISLNTWLGGIK